MTIACCFRFCRKNSDCERLLSRKRDTQRKYLIPCNLSINKFLQNIFSLSDVNSQKVTGKAALDAMFEGSIIQDTNQGFYKIENGKILASDLPPYEWSRSLVSLAHFLDEEFEVLDDLL